jgi:hypothetical protein
MSPRKMGTRTINPRGDAQWLYTYPRTPPRAQLASWRTLWVYLCIWYLGGGQKGRQGATLIALHCSYTLPLLSTAASALTARHL